MEVFKKYNYMLETSMKIDNLRLEIRKLVGTEKEADIFNDIKMYSYSMPFTNSSTIISFLDLKLKSIIDGLSR